MTKNFTEMPTATQTGDAIFFDTAMNYRALQEEVQELEGVLDHLVGQRKNLAVGKLIRLGQMEEIKRLSEKIDRKKDEMNRIVEELLEKFYPSNPTVRSNLNGVWIGVDPLTAIRFSEDLKSIEIKSLQ